MATSSSWRGIGGKCRILMTAAKTAAASTSKSAATSSSKAAATKSTTSKKTTRANGITKVVPVSPQLRDFVGASEVSRTDAIKKVWDYIKLHSLQNPANKKEIQCDQKLKTIFDGKDKVGFLEIPKLLSQHFVKSD